MFAISGLDIALWDLAARAKGQPLHRLLGEAKRAGIPAYASLRRIGTEGLKMTRSLPSLTVQV